VLSLLAADPGSKRAVITILRARELEDPANPDVSCTLGLQFLIRHGRLHTVAYLRANDAVTGLLCDVFSFTLIAEYAAGLLGVGLGTYGHHVGSMHINDYDAAKAAAIIGARRAPTFPVQAMPPTWPADLGIVADLEQALRLNQTQIAPGQADSLGLPPYWQQVVLLFEAYRQIVHLPGSAITPQVLDALEPGYRWLFCHRWPERVSVTARTEPRETR